MPNPVLNFLFVTKLINFKQECFCLRFFRAFFANNFHNNKSQYPKTRASTATGCDFTQQKVIQLLSSIFPTPWFSSPKFLY